MAAALRYKCDFQSEGTNINYTIQIWDGEGAASVTDFRATRRGFTIRYNSESPGMPGDIVGTECSVEMYIDKDGGQEAIIADLVGSPEGRFFVRILKAGIVEWVGVVLPDIGSYAEDVYPYIINIRATDGIGALKGKPFFDDEREEPWEGKDRFLEGILKCLRKIRTVATTDFWANGDTLVKSAVDWWEASMTNSGSGTDALYQSFFEHSVFYKWEKGEKEYIKAYDVLKDILTVLGARITMYNGAFWIEQVTYRTATTVILRKYDRTGSFLGTQNFSGEKVLNRTEDAALLFGGQYEFQPSIRDHRHTFDSKTRRNFLAGLETKAVMGNQAQYFSVPINANGGKTTLRFSGNIKILLSSKFPDNSGNTPFLPFVALFTFSLYLKTKGLGRTIDITPTYQILYGPTLWENTPIFPVGIPIVGGAILSNRYADTYTYVQGIDVFTPGVPEDVENFTFFWELNGFYRFDNGNQYPLSDWNIDYDITDAWLEAYSEGGPVRLEDEIVWQAVNDTRNTVRTESRSRLGTSGDPNTLGAIWVKPGANFQLATRWGAGTATRNKHLEALVCDFVASARVTPNRKMTGTLWGDFGTLFKIKWHDADWLLLSGEWVAGTHDFSGDWEELNYSTPPPVSPPKPRIIPGTPVPFPPVEDNIGNAERMFQVNEVPDGTHFYPLAAGKSAQRYEAGAITTLHFSSPLSRKDFRAGETIAVMNPATGYWDSLTVAADASEGATTLSVTGTMRYYMPPNAPILKPGITNIQKALDEFPYYTSDEAAVADGLAVGDWYIADEGHTGAQPGTLKKVMQVVLP